MSYPSTDKPVLVTGGSGFIASHVVLTLLARGYRVRCTHRPGAIESVSHLLELPGAGDLLTFIEAELTDRDCWKAACDGGVEYVIHVASPHILKPVDPLSALIDPAVKGTQYVLEMCQSTASVKKLVLTSCMCAVSDTFDELKGAAAVGAGGEKRTEYDERDWNTTSSITRNAYAYSKTMAERMAYDFSQKSDCTFALVSILPFMVWGPPIANRLSFSHRFLLGFMDKDKLAILNLNICISDVRDVAAAHVMAIESDAISGRYCLCHPPLALSSVLQLVHEAYPDVELPTRAVRDFIVLAYMSRDKTWRREFLQFNLGKMPRISCRKAAMAGMVLRPPVQTIMDTLRSLREKALTDVPPEHPACIPDNSSNSTDGNSSCILS